MKININFKRIISISVCLLIMILSSMSTLASVSSSLSGDEKISEAARAEVFEAPIARLRQLLDSGAITSEEICKVYLERINSYDKSSVKLNSIISLNKNAVMQARQLDSKRKSGKIRGVLHGIPILVKDNIDVSGFPTTLGRTDRSDKVAERDADAVSKLIEQGAIILGKTNLSTDDIATRYTVSALLGETRNAYNTAYSSGGSSGGSAVAVSASFAAAALGTDTNFSLLYPAALNEVVAFRPTYGLISYQGCAKVNSSRDVVAPMTRSVADAALMLDVLTGKSAEAPYTKALDAGALKGKKVAVLKGLAQYTYNSLNEFKNTDKEITAIFDKAVEAIKAQGAEVVVLSVPNLFDYYGNCRESLSQSASAKAELKKQVESLLSESGAEAFIFPAYLSTPLKSGFDTSGVHVSEAQPYLNCSGYFASLIGLPAVCVPMGAHSCKAGAGLEFVSNANSDAELISLAYAFETATHARTVPETVPNLYKKGKVKLESPVSSATSVSSVSDAEQNSTASFSWQTLAVIIIIVAILLVCIYMLFISSKYGKKKGSNRNRHF